jgi:hypothetical protein
MTDFLVESVFEDRFLKSERPSHQMFCLSDEIVQIEPQCINVTIGGTYGNLSGKTEMRPFRVSGF